MSTDQNRLRKTIQACTSTTWMDGVAVYYGTMHKLGLPLDENTKDMFIVEATEMINEKILEIESWLPRWEEQRVRLAIPADRDRSNVIGGATFATEKSGLADVHGDNDEILGWIKPTEDRVWVFQPQGGTITQAQLYSIWDRVNVMNLRESMGVNK